MQKYRDLEKLYLMNSLGIQQLQNRAEMNFFFCKSQYLYFVTKQLLPNTQIAKK